MLTALLWGLVAASSLLVGAVAGTVRDWNERLVGLVLGFGAGALISSISFELAEEGVRVSGALAVALGLAIGAVVFYVADKTVDRMGRTGGGAGLPCCWERFSMAYRNRPCSASASRAAPA